MVLRLSGGRRLQSPRGDVARPTTGRVRSAVMNMLAHELRACRWLELCAGSAIMACEVLQRGAACVVAVERDPGVAAVARSNLAVVAASLSNEGSSMPEVAVIQQDALRFLRSGAVANGIEPFDLIYADPPWTAGLHSPLAAAVAAGGWLAPGGTMIMECGKHAAIEVPRGWRECRRKTYGTSALVLLTSGEPEEKYSSPSGETGPETKNQSLHRGGNPS